MEADNYRCPSDFVVRYYQNVEEESWSNPTRPAVGRLRKYSAGRMSTGKTANLSARSNTKPGAGRTAKVPDYSNDRVRAYAIDERMKQLGRWDGYIKELAKITKAKKFPRRGSPPE